MRALLVAAWLLVGCAASTSVVVHPTLAEHDATAPAEPAPAPESEPEPLVTPAPVTCFEIPPDYILGCDGASACTRSPAELVEALAVRGRERARASTTRASRGRRDDEQRLTPRPLDLEEASLATDLRAERCARAANDPDRAALTYHLARIYYEANQWPSAYFLFDELAIDPAAAELGVFAASLALDSLNVQLTRSEGAARADCSALFGPAADRYHARFCEPMALDAELCETLERLRGQIAARQAETAG